MDRKLGTCLEAALVHTEASFAGGAHALCSSGSIGSSGFCLAGWGADDIGDGTHVLVMVQSL